MAWPWKENDQEGSEAKDVRVVVPFLLNDHQENQSVNQKQERQGGERNRPSNNEASGSWSLSININSTSSSSSCGSAKNCAVNNKVDVDTDCLDYEILWEYLTIGEQIGQGSCGTVYHAL
ncbi:uncharacterized protein LOC110266136 [Arachis ipaensis]|uniref:uncharacterized protein LOC110266136 n=1 Tax=Arachis ipaensis TaxID=130454 RepID=UPI000A2B10A8|nr:uncharacterized protein LOC110266136 [Arachis ipaensis]